MTWPTWLQRQLNRLRQQRGHALLLAGPPGLGQYALALELARTWLCEQPQARGSCGQCASCHAVDVRTHPDLFVLMPDVTALELDWPLDPKTQDKIDKKELKPSKFIRVDPTREAVAFTQTTASRGGVQVVLIYPADRLNVESANALLKTLEEPPGAARFILATDAAHALLPTIRSRCLAHAMEWPTETEALAWLSEQTQQGHPPQELRALLRAAGGRPDMALDWLQTGLTGVIWARLPREVAQGRFDAIQDWPIPRQMDVLQKICHDLMSACAGAQPRFFEAVDLPTPPGMASLNHWRKDLMAASRSMEHPFNPGLLQEAWAVRARQALTVHSSS